MLSKIRVISVLLIVLLAASAFAGGGSSSGPSPDSKNIRVLYYLEATVPTSVADANWAFAEFARLNPDVTVDRENLFSEAFHDKMRAYAASGNLPDVMYVWPSGRSAYLHDEGLLRNLTPLINRDNLAANYQSYAFDPRLQQSGYVAMIPNGVTATHTFWSNTEVLSAAGLQPAKTYAELVAQVSVLRARGYGTILMGAKDEWVIQSCFFSMLAGRFCGEGWDQRIFSGQAKFTDADFVAALTFMKRMFDDGVLNPDVLGIDYSESPGLFASNRYAYMIDGDWRVSAFTTDKDTGQALLPPARQNNITIGVFPDIDGVKFNNSNSTILATGWAMSAAIPVGSAREDAAWRLVKWLSGREVMARTVASGGVPSPARTDLNIASMPLEPLQIAYGNLSWGASTIVIDGPFGGIIETECNVGLAELGMGLKTPVQVAQDLQRAFDAYMARR
jgi:raffinose/stachyose/melibiose transport system substrate-binding protein